MISPAFLARVAVALGAAWLAPAAEAETRLDGKQPIEAQVAPARPCAARAAVIERLETRFGETRQSMGLNRTNGVVEVFASEETGTWTIVLTTPNGQSCLIASGDMWEPNAAMASATGRDV